MKPIIKTNRLHNIILFLISSLGGYSLWGILSTYQPVSISHHIPLCFYNADTQTEITAPEEITVTLRGKRALLANLDYQQLAAHLDAEKLHLGKQTILLSETNLFLPEGVKLLKWGPIPLTITVNSGKA